MTVDEDQLDRAFAALGDPVRRAMIARLSRGEATVNELAEPFEITKQAVSRHIQVLEAAGLITRSRDGQRRPCHLNAVRPGSTDRAGSTSTGSSTERRFRRMEAILETVKEQEK